RTQASQPGGRVDPRTPRRRAPQLPPHSRQPEGHPAEAPRAAQTHACRRVAGVTLPEISEDRRIRRGVGTHTLPFACRERECGLLAVGEQPALSFSFLLLL